MMYSVFFQILSSWEVIVTIIVILIILPLTFYITAQQKGSPYNYIGVSRKKTGSKQRQEEKSTGDKDTDNRREEREEPEDTQTGNDDDEDDRARYEVLKKLKGQQ